MSFDYHAIEPNVTLGLLLDHILFELQHTLVQKYQPQEPCQFGLSQPRYNTVDVGLDDVVSAMLSDIANEPSSEGCGF